MTGVKVLISPLSWGYGHAGRMIPLALELKKRGCEVIFAADAGLLQMAGKDLPGITLVEIPGLKINYSRFLPQYLCIFLQLPRIIISAVRDQGILRRLAETMSPEVIISDNRFGFYHRDIFSVYVTHQVRIPFPAGLRFMEPLASLVHRIIIKRYDLCLVPDYPGEANLSGRLSHRAGSKYPGNLVFTGPLSRFAPSLTAAAVSGRSSFSAAGDPSVPSSPYVCLLLSGPEPQRSLLLEKVVAALCPVSSDLLPAKSPGDPRDASVKKLAILSATPLNRLPQSGSEIQYIISPSTATMFRVISGASLVIARAGYSSIMELASMGMGAVLVPTPGQPEQEYLARYLDGRYGFVTLRQTRIEELAAMTENLIRNDAHQDDDNGAGCRLPDAGPLLVKAINRLIENNKK